MRWVEAIGQRRLGKRKRPSDANLYDIDTLEQLAEEARAKRLKQIEQCERIIDAELAKLNLPGM